MLFQTAGSGTGISVAPSVFLFLILSHSQFFWLYLVQPFSPSFSKSHKQL